MEEKWGGQRRGKREEGRRKRRRQLQGHPGSLRPLPSHDLTESRIQNPATFCPDLGSWNVIPSLGRLEIRTLLFLLDGTLKEISELSQGMGARAAWEGGTRENGVEAWRECMCCGPVDVKGLQGWVLCPGIEMWALPHRPEGGVEGISSGRMGCCWDDPGKQWLAGSCLLVWALPLPKSSLAEQTVFVSGGLGCPVHPPGSPILQFGEGPTPC
ncbi:hypothetical protein Cadr_000028532 [Camelus dromedarius]|uniref:Uncharacterized protein n=1 Tax=Camelus dromedarius TaxID=9838 RepID=A0A5N4CHK2_CAMDR|nr:hypothetical protein Cadr_000028532 [Camelus dromedarius]